MKGKFDLKRLNDTEKWVSYEQRKNLAKLKGQVGVRGALLFPCFRRPKNIFSFCNISTRW